MTITSFIEEANLFFIFIIFIYPSCSSFVRFLYTAMSYFLLPDTIHLIKSVTLNWTKSKVSIYLLS